MELPTQKTAPKSDIKDFTVLVYGPVGIGKSEFCSHADSALFIATEPGLNALEVFQVPVTTWEELTEVLAKIAGGDHNFQTLILDTIDNAFRMCADYICKKHGILHPTDLEYGKGWGLVNNEFTRILIKARALGLGLYMISHSSEKELDTRTGKIMHTRPTLPDKMREIIMGMVDIILFADFEGPDEIGAGTEAQRILRTKPARTYEAKDRFGKLPEHLPLDYEVFRAAFVTAAEESVAKPQGGKRAR
jgi:hypothetical protein